MPSSLRIAHADEDEEDGVRSIQAGDDDSDDGSECTEGRELNRSRKLVTGAALSLFIAAIFGTLYFMNRPSPQTQSVHHLMHSPQFHHAVRERVLLSAGQNGQHDLNVTQVDLEVAQGLAKALSKLEDQFPDVSKKLKSSMLPRDQEKALLTLIGNVHDKRLTDIGSKAIKVVLANALSGPKVIRQRLEEHFQPVMPQLEALHRQIVPGPIRAAKASWYERMRKKSAQDKSAKSELDGGWEVLLHPKSIAIMEGLWTPSNQTADKQMAQRRLSFTGSLAARIGVGISGIVLDALNIAVIELSYLLNFKMPWWGWLLTLLPGVSLGVTSCAIAPIEKFYSDYWCVDFLAFTGMQALTVLVNQPQPTTP